MMKSLFIIRHAKSSWEDPRMKDFDRPLNRRGMRDAPFMAKMMKGRSVQADKIISSPANRAITTAGYFADEQDISRNDLLVKHEIYEASSRTLLNLVQNLDSSWQTVFMFGHNPGFTSLANIFEGEYIPNIPTCGIVHIEANIEDWKSLNGDTGIIRNFYYPKQYF